MPSKLKASSIAALAPLLATGASHAQLPLAGPTNYVVTFLPAPGPSSTGVSINLQGDVAGPAVRADGQYRHATLWQRGQPIDLGALGGRDSNSSLTWDGLNERGMVAGFTQTSRVEPLGQAWSCSAFFGGAMPTGRICLGFVWQRGKMTGLQPFAGGFNSYASGLNLRGEVTGWAENGVRDPTCKGTQKLRFRAAIWNPARSDKPSVELPPLGRDETSAATSINNRGDAVGISGECGVAVGGVSAKRSVLWIAGRPREIPNFGGTGWNTPGVINDFREVIGFANKPGAVDAQGGIDPLGFYWTHDGGLRKVGPLPGDTNSFARGINRRGQVVGYSYGGANGNRAILWRRDGSISDLNKLVVGGDRGTLVDAYDINDLGQITGAALDSTGKRVAFIAKPVRGRN